MGNICVKLYMIIVSYVYKKPVIIIEHRSRHKCVKRMDSQISNLVTHNNMIRLQKLSIIESANPKQVILKRSCKLHHIPYLITTNYLCLPLITLLKSNPFAWRPHQCAHHVLTNSSCL